LEFAFLSARRATVFSVSDEDRSVKSEKAEMQEPVNERVLVQLRSNALLFLTTW